MKRQRNIRKVEERGASPPRLPYGLGYTDGARNQLGFARIVAGMNDLKSWAPLDLLFALCLTRRSSVAKTFLSSNRCNAHTLGENWPSSRRGVALRKNLVPAKRPGRGALRVLKDAVRFCRRSGHENLGTEHLLLAILNDPDRDVTEILHELDLDAAKMYEEFRDQFLGKPKRRALYSKRD